MVLPLRNPIQLAEEIAMLDILTKGRVEVGFGTGYQQYEFDRFGVKLEENRAMFEEALDLITKLLRTENVTHQGRYWNLPETTILPRPITQPHPPFWRATSSVPTMAWSLEHGLKVITGGTASSMDRIINKLASLPRCGRDGQGVLAAGVHHSAGRICLRFCGRRQIHAPPCHLAYAHGPAASQPMPCQLMPAGR